MNRVVFCDYCNDFAKKVSGEEIYPHRPDLFYKVFWSCNKCEAYVGCHEKSEAVPLGRLANAELRRWKKTAHLNFDNIWKSGKMKRKEAYLWLSEQMSLEAKECHIGMFTVDQCKKVVEVVLDRGDK